MINKLFNASKVSAAGVELWNLYDELSNEFSGDKLIGRFDSNVDFLSTDAQALYKQIKKEK
jgi:hypothetical protein